MVDLAEVGARARALALQIVWDQWDALGYLAPEPARRPRNSVVDPEALLLLSILVREADDRLRAVMRWWIEARPDLWSMQRLRRLLVSFPRWHSAGRAGSMEPALLGREARWYPIIAGVLAGEPLVGEPVRQKKREIQLLNPAALVLRSRLLLGVNPRSDILVYLLGRGVDAASVREIAGTTVYAHTTVHQILQQLAASRLVLRKGKRPHRYSICTEAWQEVFGRDAIKSGLNARIGFRRLYGKKTAARMWLCWAQVFSLLAFLTTVDADGADNPEDNPYVHAVFQHCLRERRTFIEHRLYVPTYHGLDPRRFQLLHDCIDAVAEWYAAQA